ncbi:AfsR/SARP family transcriptional regulator [Pseudofrankia asymbiotica]|uniref:AfsR/SARP family transcriptional regulator n=1 Tax=Pseudofrankia asymbiotica TaxID=1834516 RepID=UPI001054341D|nr:bacterial transcriptional activator domain-containing protein [Pseudofrankia asymbiotica]
MTRRAEPRRGPGGRSLLAAGLLAALARRRMSTLAARHRSVREALRLAADVDAANFLDRATRLLSAGLAAEGRPLPPVFAATLTDNALILHLAPAPLDPPPAPWWKGGAPGTWRIERPPETPGALPAGADETIPPAVPAPFPGLATVGHNGNGARILVDIEGAPGVIAIGGDQARGREIAMSIAVELATNRWSDDLRIHLIGFPDDPPAVAPDRLRTVATVGEALAELAAHEERRAHATGVPWDGSDATAVLHGRREARTQALWAPDLLVLASPPDEADTARLARFARGRGQAVGVVVVGDMAAARWVFTASQDGRLALGVLGIEVTAQLLPVAQHAALVDLFRSLDDDSPHSGSQDDNPQDSDSQNGGAPGGPSTTAGEDGSFPPPTVGRQDDEEDRAGPGRPGGQTPLAAGPATAARPVIPGSGPRTMPDTFIPPEPFLPTLPAASPPAGPSALPVAAADPGTTVPSRTGGPPPRLVDPRVPPDPRVLPGPGPAMVREPAVTAPGPATAAPSGASQPPPRPTGPPAQPGPDRPPPPAPGATGPTDTDPHSTTNPRSTTDPRSTSPDAPRTLPRTGGPTTPPPTGLPDAPPARRPLSILVPTVRHRTPPPPDDTPARDAPPPGLGRRHRVAGPPGPGTHPSPTGPVSPLHLPYASATPPAELADPREAEIRVLGRPTVYAPGPVARDQVEPLTELLVYLALHPDGAHPRALAAALRPDSARSAASGGAAPDVVTAASLGHARDWLGTGPSGHPRLIISEDGRLRLGRDVRCDWWAFAAHAHRAGQPPSAASGGAGIATVGSGAEAELAAALGLVTGPLLADLPAGRYGWLRSTGLEAGLRAAVVDVAHRLAERSLHAGDTATAMAACRTGLRAVPAAEPLWRDLLRTVAARGDRRTLEAVAAEMYRALPAVTAPRPGVSLPRGRRPQNRPAEPETNALLKALLPGYRHRDRR